MGFKDRFKKILQINDEKTSNGQSGVGEVQNFKYLDDLIHSGIKKIVLDCDIVIDENEQSQYLNGIEIDVDDLTIDGNGHSIDAMNKTRIFQCTSKNVVIRNLTLQNGGMLYSSILSTAGAIHNNGNLSVQNCIFKSNISREDAGTILNSVSGDLFIDNALIENGNAGDGAGAIFNRGILKITNSRIYNNTSKWNYGGAIYNSKKMTIENVSFKNNTNYGKDIRDSFWRDMFAGIEYSDDIYNSGEAVLIDVDFDTSDVTIFNKGFIAIHDCKEKVNSGDVANFFSLKDDEKSFTSLNKLVQGKKEIKLEDDFTLDAANLENLKFPDGIIIDADDCIIDGNGHTIDSQGMGNIFSVTGKNVVIKNLNLKNARYGAIINSGSLKVSDALFENNKGVIKGTGVLTVVDSIFKSNRNVSFGGGATIINCVFETNSADDGGALTARESSISNCRFNDNVAKRGGAIFSYGASISGCIFNNNIASDKGGAIFGSGTVTNCIFNSNNAKDGKSVFASDEININNSKFNEEEFSKEPSISNGGIMVFFTNEINRGSLLNKKDAILKLYGSEKNEKLMIGNEGKIIAFDFESDRIDFAEIENNGRIIFSEGEKRDVGEYFSSELEWIEIKIFISSTFKDMHAERDYLCTEVFPKLKEWCRQRRILLNEIDLRWGVTADDSKSGNTINVCLKSIDECHPFFLCFIGQRRGWVPSVYEINVNENTLATYPQIKESIGKLSITEMEIEHATLLPMVKILQKDSRKTYSKQAVFFFRNNPFENVDLTSEQKAIYLNENKQDDESLEGLKDLIRQDFPAYDYSCRWEKNLLTYELETFGGHEGRIVDFKCDDKPLKEIVVSELKKRIEDEFPNQKPASSEDSYLNDAMLHRLDVESYANECVGRENEFKYLNDYIGNDANENILLVKGERGIGKTTLLCKWNAMLKGKGFKPIMRICNSTSKSNSINDLCLSIGSEMGLFNGDEEKARNDNKYFLDKDFIEKLKDKGANVLIISDIDKIGQLNLKGIPEDFHVILDSDMDYELEADHDTFVLEGLETHDKCLELIDNFMGKCLKNLDDEQKDLIISKSSSKSPLFLKIVLNEISLFGSFEELNDKILSFGNSTKTAFQEVIRTLDADISYPDDFVKYVLLMLSYSKYGLNEHELLHGLSLKFNGAHLKEHLMIFLRRINEYVSLIYDKYSIHYDELQQAIFNQFGYLERDVRKILVEVYIKSMLSASDDLTFYDIGGSTELLYNLEILGEYDRIVEVFKNDDLLDKICPYQYLMEYKSGRFYYVKRLESVGFLIRNRCERSGFFRQISFALLKRADRLLNQASIEYPKPYRQWADKFRSESEDSFAKYRDTFYEMPSYVSASLKYAKMSVETEKDSDETIKFWEEYKTISNKLISFFKAISDDGAEYLGLSHQVEDLAFSAERDYDKLDKYLEKNFEK